MTAKGHGTLTASSSSASRWRDIITEWKSTFEVAGVVLALLISFGALVNSSRAIKLTRAALKIQQTEFHLRTRPYIVLGSQPVEITGPGTTAEGGVQNHILTVKLRNPTDIPALNVYVAAVLVVDNKAGPTNTIPSKSVSPFGKVAIFREDEPRYPIAIPDDTYVLLTAPDHTISVNIEVTYYGVLQKSLSYTTEIQLIYDHVRQKFFVSTLDPE